MESLPGVPTMVADALSQIGGAAGAAAREGGTSSATASRAAPGANCRTVECFTGASQARGWTLGQMREPHQKFTAVVRDARAAPDPLDLLATHRCSRRRHEPKQEAHLHAAVPCTLMPMS